MGVLNRIRFQRQALAAGCEVLDLPRGLSPGLCLVPLLAELVPGAVLIGEGQGLADCRQALERSKREVVYASELSEDRLREVGARSALGLVEARLAVIETGAVGWVDRDGRSRVVTGLPPVLAVLIEPEALVPDLGEALESLVGPEIPPRWITLMAGPSRTADIEMEMILGAHGPGRLILLLREERG